MSDSQAIRKMSSNLPYRIGVLFSYQVSLAEWKQSGIMDREIRLYQEIAKKKNFDFLFITYGGAEDIRLAQETEHISVLPIYEKRRPPRTKVGTFVHSLFLAWILRDDLKQIKLLKTNQVYGAWPILMFRLIQGRPILVRAGYEWYRFVTYERRAMSFRTIVKVLSTMTYWIANRIHLPTVDDAEFVSNRFWVSPKKISVVPNCIDVRLFKPIQKVNRRSDRILFVGRPSPQKNLVLLLESLEGLKVGLDVVGIDETEGAVYLDIARRLDVSLSLVGKKPNLSMPEIYSGYQIYVVPSAYEGNPKSVLEALACGCAVIGTDVPGINNLLEHQVTGILVQPTVDGLREGISTVCSNTSLRQALSENGVKFIQHFHSLDSAIEKEIDAYSNLIRN